MDAYPFAHWKKCILASKMSGHQDKPVLISCITQDSI
jgi:hypothetical protein